MTITVNDLRFFKSERMTDFADGGGQMTGNEVVAGVENEIHDDISDVDRAAGDVSLRKVYAAVTSANTDKYLDAGVVVFDEPADPNVSILLTSTGDFYDERAAIQSYVENYRIQSNRYFAWLFELQIEGARTLTFFARESDEAPPINTTLCLVEYTSSAWATESHRQYVRVIRILLDEVQTFTDGNGPFQRRVITVELSEALRYTFHGAEINRLDNIHPLAVVYNTMVVDAARYYGIRPLVQQADTGDTVIYADSIMGRIIPSSQIESPVTDVTAVAERTFAVPASLTTISFQVADTFIPGFVLYAGRPIVPRTLAITVDGGELVDDGGNLKSGMTSVGEVDYAQGVITFSNISPTYSGTKTVTFRPAAAISRCSNSYGIPITDQTRFRAYVASLKPIPDPGTLIVDYLSGGNWYRLREEGNGALAGASTAYGGGTINFTTGSLSLTLGSYPDINSSILISYGSGADTRSITQAATPLVFRVATGRTGLVPGQQTLAWSGNTLTDQGDGTMTGTGGSAVISYGSGEILLTPTTIPAADTALTFAGQQYTPATDYDELFTPTATAGVLSITLAHSPIIPLSLEVFYNVEADLSAVNDADYPLTTRVMASGLADNSWRRRVRDNVQLAFTAGGTINPSAGTFTLETDCAFEWHTVPVYEYVPTQVRVWDDVAQAYVIQVIVQQVITSFTTVADVPGSFQAGSTVTVRYSASNTPASFSDSLTLATGGLVFSLQPETGEQIASGSVRLLLGDRVYQDVLSAMVYAFNPVTGAGTSAGSIDATTGQVTLTDWPSVANSYTIQARAVRINRVPVSVVVFRTPTAPIAVSSFSFRVTIYNGDAVLEGSANEYGVISGSVGVVSAYGRFDYQTGVAQIVFGQWVTAAGNEGADWYHASAVVGGQILKPHLVDLETLLYNCVTYVSMPLDSAVIGIDPVRLPGDGLVPIYRTGQMALVHHTATHSENSLSPTQQVDMGRLRLYRVTIEDADGVRFPASFYSVNRDTGIVTMASDLNLTGYTAPYAFKHTVADLSVIMDTDLSGRLALTRAVSHTFPANTSRVSPLLYIGTLQARYTSLFAQTTWTEEWSDTRIGDAPLAQYNDVTYPITVSNLGAYPDRFLIRFTSSTAFVCYGEQLGYLGAGNINEDFAPINPLTSAAYFTLDYRGWGAGWSTGNCIRFNLVGACYPVDVIRAIQPSSPAGDVDSVELLFIGNIDA